MSGTVSELMAKNISNAQTNVNTWGGIIYNVKAYGAKADGTTDDTAAIASAITAANGATIAFPKGTYIASSVTFSSNSHVVFFNAKLKRVGGTGSFITSGQNSVLEGSLEIDGNKSTFTPATTLRGLYLSQGSRCYAKVYSHDCAGHGIYMESDTHIYSPKCVDNGSNPGGSGTGDGIYTVNANQVKIVNPYCTGNARNGISVTTFDAGTGLTDKTLSTDVEVVGAYVADNGYVDLDAEGIGGGIIRDVSGWGTFSANSSERCIIENVECDVFSASNHDYITVKNVRCKPTGTVSNVFYVSGKNYNVDNIYLFDTASSYGTSNTFECADGTNSKGTLRNVTVEKGYNAVVASGVSFMENCEGLAATNLRMRIDSRRPNASYQRAFRVYGGKAKFIDTAAPASGTWVQGDSFEYAATSAAGKFGKTCTTAGSPGTWKDYGAIDA